jgi:hypothetical protein
LCVGGRYLEQPARTAPRTDDDDHLDVGRLAGHCFDDGGGLIFGAGLQFVFAGGGVNGKPAAVGQAVKFLAIEEDGGLGRISGCGLLLGSRGDRDKKQCG